MKLLAWISVIALACAACKGEGKSPFQTMGGPVPAGSAVAGSAAASATASSEAGPSGASGSAATGSAAPSGAGATAVATGSAADATGSGSAVSEPLKVGDRVQAQWTNGRWYPGKIVAITDAGTYDINYNDGDKSKGLPASKVRRPGTAKPAGGGGKTSTASSSNAPCPGPGLTRRCGGRCVNIQEDSNNCGGCGNKCSSGKRCDGHMFCRDAAGNL
jgi:hypothetical protein